MGRFEKQPDNPRVRGDLSRAAENALWAVVEDLENLQQHVLRSLQEEVKRLQAEKNRLSEDIQRLLEEKEQLQQVRQITEQQVLIRQLAEALAKHISSQLQSSLTTLANQAIESNSYDRAGLTQEQTNSNALRDKNENVEKLLDSLDDTLTITFNSLQQDLKNYQSNISQQLSRMHNQQHQGELIIADLINRLQGLEKTIAQTPLKTVQVSPPTVLQLPEKQATTVSLPTVLQPAQQQQNISQEISPKSEAINIQAVEPLAAIPLEFSQSNTTSSKKALADPLEATFLTETGNGTEPISVISNDLSQSQNTSKATTQPLTSNSDEPISVLANDLSPSQNQPSAAVPLLEPTPQPLTSNSDEPISVVANDSSPSQNQPSAAVPLLEPTPQPLTSNSDEPISVVANDSSPSQNQPSAAVPLLEPTTQPLTSNSDEPISVVANDSSPSQNQPSAAVPLLEPTTQPLTSNSDEPISVVANDSSSSQNQPPPALRSRKQGVKSSSFALPSSPTLSSIQIGFLLIVLSTVVSSLYNVAIKVIFDQNAAILGVVEVERLLLPTLGNTLLILMLRLLVVVPLMLLLAPIMHPLVWQDLQSLLDSVRGSPTPLNLKTRKVLQLSIASGCFLFLSQVLIYLAIGQVTTGMAITLFFIYPLISALLSWFLFRDRPSLFRSAAIGALFLGELLVLGGATSPALGNVSLGSSTAIFSGVAFAFYVVLTRICASKLHPVSFTLINFSTMLLLSFIGLMLPLPGDLGLALDSSKLLEIILSAFILGVLTLFGYVVNNVGIRQLGAIRSAIIGASVPFLTVIFAGLLIQENLEFVQILGVLLVTFGSAAFSFEKMRNHLNSSNSSN